MFSIFFLRKEIIDLFVNNQEQIVKRWVLTYYASVFIIIWYLLRSDSVWKNWEKATLNTKNKYSPQSLDTSARIGPPISQNLQRINSKKWEPDSSSPTMMKLFSTKKNFLN